MAAKDLKKKADDRNWKRLSNFIHATTFSFSGIEKSMVETEKDDGTGGKKKGQTWPAVEIERLKAKAPEGPPSEYSLHSRIVG